MTPLEKEYRGTATRIGCTLLIFCALSLIRGGHFGVFATPRQRV